MACSFKSYGTIKNENTNQVNNKNVSAFLVTLVASFSLVVFL